MPTLTAKAVDLLVGRQATDVHELYRLFGGGDPDLMPVVVRRGLCELLRSLGYRQAWVREEQDDEGRLMWVRDPWPADFAKLREGGFETYVRS